MAIDPPRLRSPGRCAGFSLFELITVTAILAVLMRMVVSLAISGAEAQDYARRLNRVTEINQDIMDSIRMELASSVALYGRDAVSLDHFAMLDLGGWPVPLSTSLLPRIAPTEAVVPDSGNPGGPKTGNMLFFAQRAWVDSFVATSGRTYMTDVYQWVLYYMTRENPVLTDPIGLNLVHWVSEPLADARQLQAITDAADQAEVLEHLLLGTPDSNGVQRESLELAWSRGEDPTASGTWYQIDASTGHTLSPTPVAPRPDPFRITAFKPLQRQGLLTLRHHSVATIYADPDDPVCRLGIQSASGDGFPHAFEVQVVGPNAARQVVLRSTLLSTNMAGLRAHSAMQILVDCRDL